MAAVKDLTEDDLHHVFAVECRGDTLIITPRGDAHGFPESHFRSAVRALHGRFDGCRPRNLIIDLTTRDYPGLEMLGAFRDLIETVRKRGGTAAVVGASPGTTRVMEEFDLGGDWTVFPDLSTATRAVVHEPWRHRLWRHRRAALLVAVGLLLPLIGAAAYGAIDHRKDAAAFRRLGLIWSEYRQLELMPFEEPERRRARESLAARAARLAKEFEAEKLWTASFTASKMKEILRSPQQPDPRATAFEKELTKELKTLDGTDRRLFAFRVRPRFGFED